MMSCVIWLANTTSVELSAGIYKRSISTLKNRDQLLECCQQVPKQVMGVINAADKQCDGSCSK